ncbi:MAG: sarcosine oxidase subunit delta [Rhizobiaceae bacterium]
MLLIHCPYCKEDRPELEFRHAGQAHVARPSNIAGISDEAFEDYFFIRDNPKGLYFERWRHIHGCARFFNAARNTVTDRFVATYKAGEKRPDLSRVADAARAAYANVEPAKLNRRPVKSKPAVKATPAKRVAAKGKTAAKAKPRGAKKQ